MIFNNFDLNQAYLLTGVLGFILALSNTIYLVISRRGKVFIEFKGMELTYIEENNPVYLLLCIQNKSCLPLTISRMFFVVGDKEFEFEWLPQLIYSSEQKVNNQIIDSKYIYSNAFPANISGLDMLGGHFCVYTDEEMTDERLCNNHIFLILRTSKGIKKFILDKSAFKKLSYVKSRIILWKSASKSKKVQK